MNARAQELPEQTENYLTFADVARRMQSAGLERSSYENRRKRPLEGTTISFFYSREWFSVNVYDAIAMPPEDVLEMLKGSPDTRIDSFKFDDYGGREYWGSAKVRGHWVMVWYHPHALG